jgi:hypothetical protein
MFQWSGTQIALLTGSQLRGVAGLRLRAGPEFGLRVGLTVMSLSSLHDSKLSTHLHILQMTQGCRENTPLHLPHGAAAQPAHQPGSFKHKRHCCFLVYETGFTRSTALPIAKGRDHTSSVCCPHCSPSRACLRSIGRPSYLHHPSCERDRCRRQGP